MKHKNGRRNGFMTNEYEKYEKVIRENETIEAFTFVECEFHHCDFSELKVINTTFTNCIFSDCTILNMNFTNCSATGNHFFRCVIIGMVWGNLLKTDSIFLPFDKIEKCVFRYHSFYKLDLRKKDFSECDLSGCMFENCNLSDASFVGTNLKETIFDDNNLIGADFRNAKDYLFDVRNNQVKGAKFSMPEAVNLLLTMNIILET
jgi:fluoroquinolone resistance protein